MSMFLCLWDSRADSDHYAKKVWPPREDFTPGSYSVKFVRDGYWSGVTTCHRTVAERPWTGFVARLYINDLMASY